MRLPISLAAALFFLGLPAWHAHAGGLAALWAFDGALADEAAGQAGHASKSPDDLTARDAAGKPTAARFVTEAELPGASGKAIALGVRPGDAEYFTATLSDDLRLGTTYTIEAWIHPTQLYEWNRLVLLWGAKPRYAYHLALHRGQVSLWHCQRDGSFAVCEGGGVQTGLWQHVAAVAARNAAQPAKSTLAVYLNGRLAATAAFDGTVNAVANEDVAIGDSAGGPAAANRFRGYLDDVAVWTRALSREEIAAHYARRAKALLALQAAKRADLAASVDKLGIEEIVFAERHPGRDPSGHYYANFGYCCAEPTLWLHGADGGRLSRLNLRTGEVTPLVDDPKGALRDPQVHYDAGRVLFSYRKGGSHCYNLYEIRLDGTGLRQITSGPWDDVEPAYLPDGDIVFCSTRARRYIGCWFAPTALLFRCGPDGRGLRMLSSGNFTENTPAVLPDGRLLYTRWEYVNRDAVSFHHLWTMNPDGSCPMAFFGNTYPGGVFIDAQPIPGSDRIAFIHSPGHGVNEHQGEVATVSSRLGPDAMAAMSHLTRGGGFRDPYPLSPEAFLAARGNQVVLLARGAGTPRLQAECTVLHTAAMMVHEPRPVRKRPREALVAPRLDAAKAAAEVVLTDVYRGRHMAGVPRGSIRKLLVVEDLPKPANYHGGGSQPIGHGVTSTLKRILGTVPVEADGSAYFEAPAMRSLYFVALDAADRSVKQMRSFVTFQPGEAAGCVGCHEPRSQAPVSVPPQALGRPASRIEPIAGVPPILDFPRDIQPVLDRHCVRCHGHERRDGGVALVADRGPVFSLGYYDLFLHWQIKDTAGNPGQGSGRQNGGDLPNTTYSSASPLMKMGDGSHYDAKLGPQDARLVRLWIDTGAQYAGTYAAIGTGQVGGCWRNNEPIREMADGWPSTAPARDAIQRRCAACHPKEQLPQHVTAQTAADHGDMLSWTRPLSRYSRHRVYDLSRPEKSLILLAPLARGAGGYAEGAPEAPKPAREDKSRPPKPVVHPVIFPGTTDPDYRAVLAHIQAAKARLDEIKRFDMPGFRPGEGYVREMQRFGILPPTLDPNAPLDPYATDQAYWRSFWHDPAR